MDLDSLHLSIMCVKLELLHFKGLIFKKEGFIDGRDYLLA